MISDSALQKLFGGGQKLGRDRSNKVQSSQYPGAAIIEMGIPAGRYTSSAQKRFNERTKKKRAERQREQDWERKRKRKSARR